MVRNSYLAIENAYIFRRNFAGTKGEANAKGDRNFCVFLDDELAVQMIRDGWNVKTISPREGDPKESYVKVTVSYSGGTPELVMISPKGRIVLSEDAIEILDQIDIEKVDLIVRPRPRVFNGKTVVKGFLQSITVSEKSL